MNTNIPVMASIQSRKSLNNDTVYYRIAVSDADTDNLPSYHGIGSDTRNIAPDFLTPFQGKDENPATAFMNFHPGQFVQLSVPGVGEMPISYCGIPSTDGSIELCVRNVGRVSIALSRLPIGSRVGVRGPLGHGFPLEEYAGRNILLIAGGVGIAPIRSLLLALLYNRDQYGSLTLLHGAREVKALLFSDELQQYCEQGWLKVSSAVDCLDNDGTGGVYPVCRLGLLPTLIDEFRLDPETTIAALCAPPAAYPSLIAKLRQQRLGDDRIHLSLERQMKCGVGRCGHCAVGSLLCCVDGPVFSLSQLSTREGVVL